LGQPDAPPGPLDQPGAGLGLQPGEVVADGRLRVVQLPRGRGERSGTGDREQDAEPGDIQHSSIVSMDLNENSCWTYRCRCSTVGENRLRELPWTPSPPRGLAWPNWWKASARSPPAVSPPARPHSPSRTCCASGCPGRTS